ncbi:hypothetical protein [Streptomyces panaciradicis]|uniref:hypothetical protein n=1 Tax=Streptomyces panaciradicis TaxID=1470261 RepID=UPI00201CF2CC|nr:hypothetical protein [Streptomyces panaciradicis]MCL6670950.1 hypothetical protein [Streptomyces panaciradicis]
MVSLTPQQQTESLLHALDPLPHPHRMRELAARVRETTPLRPLLEELETRGTYGRQLAVVAASVGRDAGFVAARIADPDSFVRGHALRVADSLGVPDSAFETGLADAGETVRRDLLRAVVASGRTALADRLVDTLREEWGDTEAARLLPGCTAGTVERLLPGLLHAVGAWTALAKRHPEILLGVLEEQLAGLPPALRGTWWTRYGHAVAAVTPTAPARVLGLLERLGPTRVPYELRCQAGRFAAADPGRVLRLLLTPAWADVGLRTLGPAVLRRLARSGRPELVDYGRSLVQYGGLPALLEALPPGRREALYNAVDEGRGGSDTVDVTVLGVLTRRHAADVARESAGRARERGARWTAVLLAESFLPVAEVRERLLAATRRPAAEDRAEAWPLLIRNAARWGDPAAVTAVLRDMERLRNEQDPVRSAALRALADTRAALFTEDAAPHLDRIAADAVEARDSSPETRRRLSALAVAVLREHAAGGSRELVNWALRTLVRISGHTGGADLGLLDRSLRRGQEHQVFEALRPWIEAGAEKADYGLAFALARAVGRRAAGMTELQELLWQAVRYGDDSTVRTAVDLWLEPPAARDERVARVLTHEPSAAVLPAVLRVLVRRRTDLLDGLLAETPPHGRFLTKGTPWSVPVTADVRRWVPRQQAALLRQLAALAGDAGLPAYERAQAVARAAHVPDGGAGLVRRWTGSSDVVLAEAALAALSRTDRPADALPELLALAGTDRARVAVYAATRASRYARPSRLAARLTDVLTTPDAKVTSRKEAVRLAAARLPVPQAARLVAETYARPGTHPDVRAACVACTAGLLAHEEIWALLRDAADAEPVLRAAVLRVTPFDLPAPRRERYAALVREVSGTGDPETADLAFAALARWTAWSPEAPGVLARAVTDLSERTTWHAAARGLVTAASASPEGALRLLEALRTLAETPADAEPDAEEGRDRPARRRVAYLAACLGDGARTAPAALRPAALDASEVLGEYDAHVPQAAALAVAHLDLTAVPPGLDRLCAVVGAGRPVLAGRIAHTLRLRLQHHEKQVDAEALLAEAVRLTGHGGHTEGLLALAVVQALGGRTDWPAPWRERLRALRRHPCADVRDEALEETTAHE